MFGIGPHEMVVVGIIAVLLFGRKLPEVARSLGTSYREFRKGLNEFHSQVNVDSYSSPSSSRSRTYSNDDDYRDPSTAPKFEPPSSEPIAGDAYGASSENASSENASSENTSSENTSSENTSSENTSSENTSSENTSSENTSSENTSSENTSSESASDVSGGDGPYDGPSADDSSAPGG